MMENSIIDTNILAIKMRNNHADVFSEVEVCDNGILTGTAYGAISVLIESDCGYSRHVERLCCSFCQDGNVFIPQEPIQLWITSDQPSTCEDNDVFLKNIAECSRKLLEEKYVKQFKNDAEFSWSVPFVGRDEILRQIDMKSYISWRKELEPGYESSSDKTKQELWVLMYDRFLFRLLSDTNMTCVDRIMRRFPRRTVARGYEEYICISHGYMKCSQTPQSLSDLLDYIDMYCRSLLSEKFLVNYGALY